MLEFPQGDPCLQVTRDKGMTLAELVVAAGLLAILVVSAVGLFLTLLSSATKTSLATAGSFLAHQRLEEVIRKNQYYPVPPEAALGLYTNDIASKTTFFHRVRCESIPPNPPEHRQAWWIEVEVWWWSDDPGQARAGHGKLHTSLGRLHFPPGAQP